MKKNLTKLFLLCATNLVAQSRGIGSVAQKLQQATADVNSSVNTIKMWVYGVLGLLILVQLVLVIVSPGTGEDKIKKGGTLLFLIIFAAIVVLVAETVFS